MQSLQAAPRAAQATYLLQPEQIGSYKPLYTAGAIFTRVSEPAIISKLGEGLCATTNAFIPANGNCQFSAIAFHYYKNKTSTTAARSRICNWLEAHPDAVAGFLAEEQEDDANADVYLQTMRTARTWGDQLTLMAASQCYEMPIAVAKVTPSGTLMWSYYPNEEQDAYAGLYLQSDHYEVLYAR